MELHARTRRDLEPDPEFDPICALFYCISSDTALPDTDKKEITGVIVIDSDRTLSSQGSYFFYCFFFSHTLQKYLFHNKQTVASKI